jgi:CPA2 family monovalent cation:H+ antiporter-2
MEGHADLTGLAVVALAALVCGLVMARLRQPAIVGYILAGVILGPSALGLVENRENVAVLAELGVIMLLFLVAMEMSLRGFMQVWRVALAAALLQIAVSVGVMMGISTLLGWPLELAVLLGFVVALSSTAVVIKMLEQINVIRAPVGQLIVGILIAQDLAVVPMILTLNAMADPTISVLHIMKIIASLTFLVLLVIWLSQRRRIVLPFGRIVSDQFDLRPLSALTLCFAAAAVTGVLGLSAPLGAFLAGLIVGNSNARAMMIRSTRPIQSVLLMVFFLSIGLLIDLRFIWDNIGQVLLLLLAVTVLKTMLNIGLLHLLREPWPHAFVAGVVLAQVGEFSFVLGQTAVAGGLIAQPEMRLIVAVTAFSLLISPIWMAAARRLMRIILLSVTSFDETFDLLIGAQLRRAQHSARDSGQAVIRGALPWLRHAGAASSKLRSRITGALPALPPPAKPANDPAPDEPTAAKKARETAEGARRAARGKTDATKEKSDKAQPEKAGAKQG